jgi:GT2 family glycosyltransferase
MAPRVSVVIPTVGRPELLAATLESLRRCDPQPDEVLVVDQSRDLVSTRVVERAGLAAARVVECPGTGLGLANNVGLRAASHPVVARVDDDCTVREDWVVSIASAMREDPEGIVTGQVLPASGGDPRAVPSIRVLDRPVDFTGQVRCDALYGGNMACPRDAVLAMGGFDEAVVPAGEDCDLCFRWLRAGRRLRHLPELVVYHHDWRTADELTRQYQRYWEGQGVFYGRHLARGDMAVLRFVARDARAAMRALAARRPSSEDQRRGIPRGLSRGLWIGLRQSRR